MIDNLWVELLFRVGLPGFYEWELWLDRYSYLIANTELSNDIQLQY